VFARRREADFFFVCWLPVVGIGGGLGWRAPNSQDIKISAANGSICV